MSTVPVIFDPAASSVAALQPVPSTCELTFTIPTADTPVRLILFGLDHNQRGHHVAKSLHAHRPTHLVVETALGDAHGATHGSTLHITRLNDAQAFDRNPWVQALAQMGIRLRQTPTDEEWMKAVDQMAPHFPGEQLAMTAAISRGVSLVFGDAPKVLTFRRLFEVADIMDLDASFANTVAHNYSELLAGHTLARTTTHIAERTLLDDRDTCLASAIWQCAMGGHEIGSEHDNDGGGAGSRTQEQDGMRIVMAVMGKSHLPGVVAKLEETIHTYTRTTTGTTSTTSNEPSARKSAFHAVETAHREKASPMSAGMMSTPSTCHDIVPPKWATRDTSTLPPLDLSATPLVESCPPTSSLREDVDAAVAVKRALAAALVTQTAGPAAAELLAEVAGPYAETDAGYLTYMETLELYGSYHMQLSSLAKESLALVCGGWGCDMYEALGGVRAARPVEGGGGISATALREARSGNMILADNPDLEEHTRAAEKAAEAETTTIMPSDIVM